jgi:hypothetical protein
VEFPAANGQPEITVIVSIRAKLKNVPPRQRRGGMAGQLYALSLKQPWAALVVHGLKTIEIRRWATSHRGPLLIHASKQWDDRAPAPELLPSAIHTNLSCHGGILGQVELVECKIYRTLEVFAMDQPQHWNPPEWFELPWLFGFRFTSARVLPFRRCKGQVRLFTVTAETST